MSVCLILGSGNQRIYATEKLAKEIKSNLGPTESLSISTFGLKAAMQIKQITASFEIWKMEVLCLWTEEEVRRD